MKNPKSEIRNPNQVPNPKSETGVRRLLSMLWLLLSILSLPAAAQPYSIGWYKIAGGGGSSTGGVYSVDGTIGQADASEQPMTGGSYTLQGGFWPGVLVVFSSGQAPTLFVQRSGMSVIVSWSPSTSGFVLEESDNLTPGSWSTAPGGSTNSTLLPIGGRAKFYRLHKP